MQAQQTQKSTSSPSSSSKAGPESGASQTRKAVQGADGFEAQSAMLAPGGASGGGKVVTGGPELAAAQTRLNDLKFPCGKPDGIMGPKTKSATSDFQGAKGLAATGALDVDTMGALQTAAPAGVGKEASTGKAPAEPVAGGGGATTIITKGPELKAAQEKLNKMGYSAGVPDGFMGPKTRNATSSFQGDKGLGKSGDIDTQTMVAIDGAVAEGFVAPSNANKGAAVPGAAGKGDQAKSGAEQKDGLEEKKTEAKKHTPPDPATVAKKDSEFASEGQAALSAVKALNGPRIGGGGDTKGTDVTGYPAWFTELQDYLINGSSWSETHEKAQNVLYRYAMWKTECDLGYVPGAIEFFFRYIGKSGGNNIAATKGGFKGSEDLTGGSKSKNWCGGATSQAAVGALKERGLRFAGGIEAWIKSRNKKATAGTHWHTACNGVALTPGDQVSYTGAHHNNNTGHRVTVLQDLGSSFTHTSGNAGGGGNGSVRIGVSKREEVPPAFNPGDKKTEPRPKGDGVWVYSIQKVGDVFAELAKLDGIPPSDPRYDGLLVELGLQRTGK